jgi:6-phosphogluconolactonase
MKDGRIKPDLLSRVRTLPASGARKARQAAGPIHVHPNGKFLYCAHRAEQTEEYRGVQVFKGGENGIVAYEIDSQGVNRNLFSTSIRAVSIPAPSTSILAAGCWWRNTICPLPCATEVAAGLSVFRIDDDGKLSFARKYDVDVGERTMF